MQIISHTPQSLPELTRSLEIVDHNQAFFGNNLYVLTERSQIDEEVVLADIMKIFIISLKEMERTDVNLRQLHKFSGAYEQYVFHALNSEQEQSLRVCHLMHSTKEIIENAISQFFIEKPISPYQCILITDIDNINNGSKGAMASRAANALSEGFPVLIRYTLFVEMAIAQVPPANTSQYHKNVRALFLDLSNKEKWVIFKHNERDLCSIMRKGSESALNLSNYQEIELETVQKLAYEGSIGIWPNHGSFTPEDIIEVMDTDCEKQIIWAGHGNLEVQALGLPAKAVSDILNQVHSVTVWDLHSCYLGTHIHQIMSEIKEINAHIMISNGIIEKTKPLLGDESLHTFFHIVGNLSRDEEEIKSEFAHATPWASGLQPESHPHLILRGSQSVYPLEFAGLSETLGNESEKSEPFTALERLFINTQYVESPIFLKHQAIMLPGLLQKNSAHLLAEVNTCLPFAKFIKTSFPDSIENMRIGEKPDDSGYSVTHHGNILFMIAKLGCLDGDFENIIHFKANGKNSETYFFIGEQMLLLVEGEKILPNSKESLEDILKRVYTVARNSSMEAENEMIFKGQIRSHFHLSEDFLDIPLLEEEEIKSELELECKPNVPLARPRNLKMAIASQNEAEIKEFAIEELNKGGKLDLALECTIEWNKKETFFYLLNLLNNQCSHEILIYCVKRWRFEFLQLLLTKEVMFPLYLLRTAICDGDLKTVEVVYEGVCRNAEFEHETFVKLALKKERWEIVQFLQEKQKNAVNRF